MTVPDTSGQVLRIISVIGNTSPIPSSDGHPLQWERKKEESVCLPPPHSRNIRSVKPSKLTPSSLKQGVFLCGLHLFVGSPDEV